MIRVCRHSTIIISCGTEEKRMPYLEEFTKDICSSIEVTQIELSKLAQLINILRSELKDKPLSYALKDKAVFMKAMMIMAEDQK